MAARLCTAIALSWLAAAGCRTPSWHLVDEEAAPGEIHVYARREHTCAVLADQSMWCWGENHDGELCDGTLDNRLVPTVIQGLDHVSGAALGDHLTTLARDDGTAFWCGFDDYCVFCGAAAAPAVAVTSPRPFEPLFGARAVGLGWRYDLCRLGGDGAVSCLSNGAFYPLGLRNVVELAAGSEFACARLADGHVSCWGDDSGGQLSDETLASVAELSLGQFHGCARLTDGTVRCWGLADVLGAGATIEAPHPAPVEPSGLGAVTHVAAGGHHSCAIVADGTVRCWGHNGFGQLGDGTTISRATPVPVVGLSHVVALALGGEHSCAIDVDQRVYCWGQNGSGQLGDGTTTDRAAPTLVRF